MHRDLPVLTDRDLAVLAALAEQRIAVLAQVAHWLGVSEKTAGARVRRLRAAGLVEHRRVFERGSPMVRITGAGLKRIDSTLSRPGQKLDEYRHDVGVGWLWTAARDGAFGELTAIHSERHMRSIDARLERMSPGERLVLPDDQPFGIGVGAYLPDGRPERHYPDLLLESRRGHHIGIELELTAKGRKRLDRVMDAYASDVRIDAVLYVVPDQGMADRVRAAAQRAGISDRVYIRGITAGQIGGVVRERTAGRVRAVPARQRGPEAVR